jgi:hypothetical protein
MTEVNAHTSQRNRRRRRGRRLTMDERLTRMQERAERRRVHAQAAGTAAAAAKDHWKELKRALTAAAGFRVSDQQAIAFMVSGGCAPLGFSLKRGANEFPAEVKPGGVALVFEAESKEFGYCDEIVVLADGTWFSIFNTRVLHREPFTGNN